MLYALFAFQFVGFAAIAWVLWRIGRKLEEIPKRMSLTKISTKDGKVALVESDSVILMTPERDAYLMAQEAEKYAGQANTGAEDEEGP